MRIFFFFSILGRFYGEVARTLHESHPGLEFSGVVYNRLGERQVLASGLPHWQYVGVFSRYREQHRRKDPADLPYLRQVEAQYGQPNLPLMMYADRFLTLLPRRKQLRAAEDAARFLEEALERTTPDVIIVESIACLVSYLLYGMARARGIPFYQVFSSRIAGRLAFVGNPHDRWEQAETIHEALGTAELTEAQRARAEAFLTDFRAHQRRPTLVNYPSLSSRMTDVRALLDTARVRLTDPEDYLYASPTTAIASRLRRLGRKVVADHALFEQPRAGESYVLLPLHFQPESSTLVMAPFYLDQTTLVENMAKSLPVGHWLYVKEHPQSVGRRPLAFYQRLKKLFNVRLIAPQVDSHALVRGADAVATINGTMGLEAILYERPVITFGPAFYNMYDQVYRVSDITRLPAIVQEAVTGFRPDREMLLKFITACLEGSYPGEVIYPSGTPTPEQWRQGVKNTAAAIANLIGLGTGVVEPRDPAPIGGGSNRTNETPILP